MKFVCKHKWYNVHVYFLITIKKKLCSLLHRLISTIDIKSYNSRSQITVKYGRNLELYSQVENDRVLLQFLKQKMFCSWSVVQNAVNNLLKLTM